VLTIRYPQVIPIIKELSAGLLPISFPDETRPNLIIKATKERLLAAKVNGGFKVYVFPIVLADQPTVGLIAAFFDNENEPLVIYTPLFKEDNTDRLIGTLLQDSIDIHFFDEHDRELLGYICKLEIPNIAKERFANASLISFNLTLARLAHDQLQILFGTRSHDDDLNAISVSFTESLIPEDLMIVDARLESNHFHGSAPFSFSQLEREEPGPFQEQDIARLLRRLFAPTHIYINPLRITDNEEVADLLLTTDSEIIILQAKDSPNTEAVLRNTIERKKLTARKALTKAMNQTKGAIRYLRSMSPLKITVNGELVEIDITNHRLRALIVVKELFNDEYSIYSPPILDLSSQTGVPCIALDYGELDMYTRMSSKCKFFEAFDLVYSHGSQTGKFPRLRIWAGDEEHL
jgi:hypothetical protein